MIRDAQTGQWAFKIDERAAEHSSGGANVSAYGVL